MPSCVLLPHHGERRPPPPAHRTDSQPSKQRFCTILYSHSPLTTEFIHRWGECFRKLVKTIGELRGACARALDFACFGDRRCPSPKAVGLWLSQPLFDGRISCWRRKICGKCGLKVWDLCIRWTMAKSIHIFSSECLSPGTTESSIKGDRFPDSFCIPIHKLVSS